MSGSAQTTTDHDTIRHWVEQRGGRPAVVKSTHTGGEGGILRIDFAEPDESLEEIGWEEFFRTFEDRKLAFLYQEEKGGQPSRFFKFVQRNER